MRLLRRRRYGRADRKPTGTLRDGTPVILVGSPIQGLSGPWLACIFPDGKMRPVRPDDYGQVVHAPEASR